MGGTNSIINVVNVTEPIIDLNEYKCSDRGLILPSNCCCFYWSENLIKKSLSL